MAEKTIWAIHGGRHGVADGLFLQRNVIALGWSVMGDVNGLAPYRASFRTAVEKAFPDRSPAQISVSFGQIYRSQAKNFAKSKSNLRLIDGAELVDLVLTHYEQFDSRYKGLLPLKRVFVPEPIDDGE